MLGKLERVLHDSDSYSCYDHRCIGCHVTCCSSMLLSLWSYKCSANLNVYCTIQIQIKVEIITVSAAM